MQDFQSLCQLRRSYRKYTNQAVEQEKLDYIVRCALMSPAGKRMNPWHCVVLKNEEILRLLIAVLVGNVLRITCIEEYLSEANVIILIVFLIVTRIDKRACCSEESIVEKSYLCFHNICLPEYIIVSAVLCKNGVKIGL